MKKPLFLLLAAVSLCAASCIVKESPRPDPQTTTAAPPAATAGADSIVFRGSFKIDTSETRIYIHKSTDTAKGTGSLSYIDGYTLATFLVDVTAGSAMPVKEMLVDKHFQPIPEGTVLFDRKKYKWSGPPKK